MDKNKGFTLIELLIVIAIIGIISAVAYPSYQESVKSSRRADAQAALLGFSQAMERHFIGEGTYMGAAIGDTDSGAPTIYSTTSPVDSPTSFYNLKIVSSAVLTYTLAAEPVGVQAGDGVLILTSTGARSWDVDDSKNGTATTTIDAGEDCWKNGC